MEKNYFIYQMDIGELMFAEFNDSLTDVYSWKDLPMGFKGLHQETPVLKEAARQMREYLQGQRKEFDLPLAPQGTSFQLAVWNALRQIPYGETRSYKDIACAIGNPNAMRAVGNANHHNPISFIIPCHRVIGADGSMIGYGGGVGLKRTLLDLEARFK
jgi:methylated-DNA-[protein]-cysteine S-methyltransferase